MEAAVSCVGKLRIWPKIVALERKVRPVISDVLLQVLIFFLYLSVTDATTVFGTGREVGADEDDFHSFKRKTSEIDQEEKQENKLKLLEVKTGAHSGVVKAYGAAPARQKKVVVFK